MDKKPILYLFPVELFDKSSTFWLNDYYIECLKSCNYIFAETSRVSRRFIKGILPEFDFTICPVIGNKFMTNETEVLFKKLLNNGENIGIMSDCGCPGIADPGSNLIYIAQNMQIKVLPLTGPSSIFLALMASGLNGQDFRFHGYLPKSPLERKKKLLSMNTIATHIFIETPYRSQQVFEQILSLINLKRLLCLGINIHSLEQIIETKSIKNWKKENINLSKKETIFLLN